MPNEVAQTRIGRVRLRDSFQNFEAALGLGANNQMASTTYGAINPLTRNRQELDGMYRGSWIVRQAVGVVADDMTRAGVDFFGIENSDDVPRMQNALRRMNVWGNLSSAIRWGRLYGGAIAVMMIEGQNIAEPLRPETIGQGMFKGLLPIDRWALQPSSEKVAEFGPDFGKPTWYDIVSTGMGDLPAGRIHHTRVVRLEGDDLPYYQRQSEMGWGMSIVESFHDRLVAFDSTTIGMAQMVYKAHLRTLRMKDLRNNIATGGKAYAAALTNVDLIRRYQSLEGLTLIDAEDEFKADSYSFSGLPDVLMQMSQQVAGAISMPLVKLFGMSPTGFSTGETDLRSYYDGIALKQERGLRHPLEVVFSVTYRSELGAAPPPGFGFTFASLWGMSAKEKADIANVVATAVSTAEAAAQLPRSIVLRELRESSHTTGIFGSITDADIEKAEREDAVVSDDPPEPAESAGTDPISAPQAIEPQEEFETRPFPLKPHLVASA